MTVFAVTEGVSVTAAKTIVPGGRGGGRDERPLRLEGALVDLLQLRVGLGDAGELEGLAEQLLLEGERHVLDGDLQGVQ